MSIGLKSGAVRLAKNHAEWAAYFASESNNIKNVLADIYCIIEHVGSTAIPGIAAKPIVDIAIGLLDMSQREIVTTRLESIGFRYRGYRDDSGGYIFDVLEQNIALCYIHLVTIDSEQWKRYILFRDYLLTSATARRRYEKTKYDLAERYPEERKSYTAAKKTIIDSLVDEARRNLPTLYEDKYV